MAIDGIVHAIGLLLGAVAVTWVARLIGRRYGAPRPLAGGVVPAQPGMAIVAATIVGAPLILLAHRTPWPVYMTAAAVGAFAAAATGAAVREIDAGFATPFFSVPALRPQEPGAAGSISAGGMVAAAAAASAVPAWSRAIGLIGPGAAALVATGALAATALAIWTDGRGDGRGKRRLGTAILGAAAGGAGAALLVAFLP